MVKVVSIIDQSQADAKKSMEISIDLLKNIN